MTARRLWKSVYDDLGGSPGSTSAATCTRRHYERLILPFERELRGEEDKPLPPTKPRKPHKRSSDGKLCKSELRRRKSQLEKESDSELQTGPELAQCGSGPCGHPPPWPHISSDRPQPGLPQPQGDGEDLSHSAYPRHLLPSIPSPAGQVISPLEKKKRVAQESLSSPGEEWKDRPSVIHCPQSPGLQTGPRLANSPEGSPLPCSSPSSRSSSPSSIFSEDCAEDRPSQPSPEPAQNCSANRTPVSGPGAAHKPQICGSNSRDTTSSPGFHRSTPQTCSLPGDSAALKAQGKHSMWSPMQTTRHTAYYASLPTTSSYAVKPVGVASASVSSFTKVLPKVVEPRRPIPFQPGYRPLQNPARPTPHEDSLSYAKKMSAGPPLYVTEKRERSRTALAKPQASQHPVFHLNSNIPVSYVLPAFERAARDARHPQALHSLLVPTHMRIPHGYPSPMYRHVMLGPAHSAPYEPTLYSYPFPLPLPNPQTGYGLAGVSQHYSQTRL